MATPLTDSADTPARPDRGDAGARTEAVGPFARLRARRLLMWVFGGSILGRSVTVLIVGYAGLSSPATPLVISYTCVFGAMIAWLVLDSGLSYRDIGLLIGPRPTTRGLIAVPLNLLATLLLSLGLLSALAFVVLFFFESLNDQRNTLELILTSYWRLNPPHGPSLLYRAFAISLIGATMVVVGPFLEELIFRGVLFTRWAIRWNAPAAIGLSSVVFVLYHLPNAAQDTLFLMVFGSLMCLFYIRTGKLLVPILCHSLWNAFLFLSYIFRFPGARSSLDTTDTPNLQFKLLVTAIVALAIGGVLLWGIMRGHWPSRRTRPPYVERLDACQAGADAAPGPGSRSS